MSQELEFKLAGETIRLSRADVIDAVRHERPEPIQKWSVQIEGRWFPVKQVFRKVLDRSDFTSHRARDVLTRLDLEVRAFGEPLAVKATPQPEPAAAVEASASSRVTALKLALDYAASRPELRATDVVAAADAFASWLDREQPMQEVN